MLKNDYLLAKIGVDTSENELSKVATVLSVDSHGSKEQRSSRGTSSTSISRGEPVCGRSRVTSGAPIVAEKRTHCEARKPRIEAHVRKRVAKKFAPACMSLTHEDEKENTTGDRFYLYHCSIRTITENCQVPA